MSTVVHHASMYAHQAQADTGATVLAAEVTAAAPATFNGLAPSTLTELQRYSAAGDFQSGNTNAWNVAHYVDLGDNGTYWWNGTNWTTPTAPGQATVSGTPTTTTITMTWTAPVAKAGKRVSGYRIARCNSGGAIQGGDTVDTTTTDLSYTKTGLTANTAYYFKVAAIQGATVGAYGTLSASITTAAS